MATEEVLSRLISPVLNLTFKQAQLCPICFEEWESGGDHCICCLKCGHLFGRFFVLKCTTLHLLSHCICSLCRSCIEEWLKSKKVCPQCKAKAARKDIRRLFSANISVCEPSGKAELEKRVAEENRMRLAAESERARIAIKFEILKQVPSISYNSACICCR